MPFNPDKDTPQEGRASSPDRLFVAGWESAPPLQVPTVFFWPCFPQALAQAPSCHWQFYHLLMNKSYRHRGRSDAHHPARPQLLPMLREPREVHHSRDLKTTAEHSTPQS